MKDQIIALFNSLLSDMGVSGVAVEVSVPENPAHGDYATNVAMKLTSKLRKKPLEIAEELKEAIIKDQKMSKLSWLDHIEVAPPGFINVFLSEASLINQLSRVLAEGERYGSVSSSPSSHDTRYTIHDTEADKKDGQSSAKKPSKIDLQAMGKPSGQPVDKSRTKAANSHLGRQKKTIMVEFAHPNTHKAFHIGHLRNITTGESLVRLFESQGHKVIRTNYQGDVGMHIAKCIYALTQISNIKDQISNIRTQDTNVKVEFLGKAYAAGSKAFEDDSAAKGQIIDLNALIYASAQRFAKERGVDPGTTDYLALVKEENRGRLDEIYTLWRETRQWSLDYFDHIYKRVYTHYDRLYFESECLAGVDRAKEAVKKGVLKESDGAIIFDGKPYGLDTRVFVNSLGLPTYEAKELALAKMESTEFGRLDRLIHVVGPEQSSFFQVTFKAEELLGILSPGVQYHLAYGWVRLKQGKMSSRLGNVVLGEDIINLTKDAIYKVLDKSESKYSKEDREEIAEKASIAAIKYSFLKVSTNSEIAFDIEESINIHGDSGPYLQYTYARCRSVLRKARHDVIARSESSSDAAISTDEYRLLRPDVRRGLAMTMNEDERLLARLIVQFPDVVREAAENYSPSTVCTYLFALAQQFNTFYGRNPILEGAQSVIPVPEPESSDKKTSSLRLALTAATAQILKNGLYLLGIETLEQM